MSEWTNSIVYEARDFGFQPAVLLLRFVNLAELLRRQTQNLLGFSRAGSNSAVDVCFTLVKNAPVKRGRGGRGTEVVSAANPEPTSGLWRMEMDHATLSILINSAS
ncbi:hypothetical protein M758_2G195600 [Ceratodon purpureus]|nr:hypothetical protein M758_2G195500 [Ceratodon purpureus]KAG0627369.1 hypothetical protein M758_2G195600 [Ceratodon purpureus]